MPNDLSIQCSAQKLNNGQKINLKNKRKTFENTKYLIIYIQSNQNNTNQTYLNGIKFDGSYSKSPTKSNKSLLSIDQISINSCQIFVTFVIKIKQQTTANEIETIKSNTESILEPSTDLEFSQIMQRISSNTLLVIEFYAKWCPHSQRIVSQYKRIAQKFKNKDVLFMKIDMDDLDEIAKDYNICSTPTFRFIFNNKCLKSIEGADIRNVMQTVQQYT